MLALRSARQHPITQNPGRRHPGRCCQTSFPATFPTAVILYVIRDEFTVSRNARGVSRDGGDAAGNFTRVGDVCQSPCRRVRRRRGVD